MGAQIVDTPHSRLEDVVHSGSEDEIDIELGARPDPPADDETPDISSEHDTASLLVTNRHGWRGKVAVVIISILFLVGVSIGVAALLPRETKEFATSGTGHINEVFGSLETVEDEALGQNGVVPFFDVQFYPDDHAVFVLSKEHWNSSFIVYATVAKHAAPVKLGMERGSILLETSDVAFHFEMSSNNRDLLFVQDYHYASVRENTTDELKRVVDDSQWPGYITKVPIYMETDTAFYIPSEVFLSNGFFVSSKLVSSNFNPIKTQSESFERNTMLLVEYEVDAGVMLVNYAISLLPKEIMPQRVSDDRVGYFSKRYTEYGDQGQEPSDGEGFHWWNPRRTVIHRRKLEVDLVTNRVKNPITYFIDPSVPTQWRKAFAAGVEAWAPAFERIGLTNAIRAVLPGDNDWPDDYRLGDLRHSSISVMISSQTYAAGPSIIDPRSGEILHSDITFEYGFINSVAGDFDVKSPVDPPKATFSSNDVASVSEKTTKRARGVLFRHAAQSQQCGLAHDPQRQLDQILLSTVAADSNGYVPDRLIAQYFAGIVMHEVGHTLGLRHNFAGSSAFTRSQLRDPKFVAEHGLSSSIMDYLPANIYSDLTAIEAETHPFYMTTVGEYDFAAIAYGYSVVDDEIPGHKHPRLTEIASSAPLFLTDESEKYMLNPYGQKFDLSSDLVDFAADRLEFVKQSRKNSALLDKLPDDASWTTLWQRERMLLRIIIKVIKTVQPMLGGVNVTPAHRNKSQEIYKPELVPRDMQLKALGVLRRIMSGESGLFPNPQDYASYVEVIGFGDEDCNELSLDYACLGRGLVDVGSIVSSIQAQAINAVLFPAMQRIVQQDVSSPLRLTEILDAVTNATTESQNENVVLIRSEILQGIVNDNKTDVRIRNAIKMHEGLALLPAVVSP